MVQKVIILLGWQISNREELFDKADRDDIETLTMGKATDNFPPETGGKEEKRN